jgi:hypothetical protein
MGNRVYSVSGDNQTLVAAPFLVHINPMAAGAAGSGFEIMRFWCDQRANATSAMFGLLIGHKASVFPTMVGATPQKTQLGDPVSGIVSGTGAAGTAGINSSADGAGTHTVVIPTNFNALNGCLYVPTAADAFTYMPGGVQAFAVKCASTWTSLTGWSFGAIYREIG